jgi:hypothetical protein
MQNHLMPVSFYEDTVVLVGKDNEPFVAMKPVVENLGLAWQAQHAKLAEKFESTITIIVMVAEDGKTREMTCLPLRKLPAWMYSINPNKVNPELREKIVRYQQECDDALWDYWTKGSASRTAIPSISQQIALSRHRITLLKELKRTRDAAMRNAIHEQLAQTSRQLGLSIPDLSTIGTEEPARPEILATFWDALEELGAKGVVYDHSKNSALLAFSLTHLAELFVKHAVGIPLTSELKGALKSSRQPQFLEIKTIYSAIECKSKKCWVFRSPHRDLN